MCDDSDGVEVNFERMHLFAQDLGCHVPRGTTSIQCLLAVLSPRYSKVSQTKIAQFVKDQILRFDIPVKDLLFVNVLDRCHNASDQKFSLILSEFVGVGQSTSEVGSRQQIHDQVQVVPVIECTDHVGNE
mgnify:CR=1 FL=1